jgi:hypothetical protein
MKDRISEKVREFTAELLEFYPLLLTKYPLYLYDKEIKPYTEYYSFIFFSPKLVKIFDRIEKQYNANAVALYHKLSLSTFMLDTIEKLESQNVPVRIIALYHKWFDRVYRDFSVQPDSYYHHEKDPFRKDLAVCRRKAIPVGGAWIVELSRIITKNQLTNFWLYGEKKASTTFINKRLRKRVLTLLHRLRLDDRIIPILMLILERLSVYRPYYVIHTVDRYLPRFNERQMNQAYMNISELLKLHSNICGIYRESWFLDPNLKDISPELSFLWEVPKKNGAKLFHTETSDEAVKKAIIMSPLRRKLYEEGEYMPMSYAYIWPRDEFLRWTSEQ